MRVPFFTSDGSCAWLTTGVCRTGSTAKPMTVGDPLALDQDLGVLAVVVSGEREAHGEDALQRVALLRRASG